MKKLKVIFLGSFLSLATFNAKCQSDITHGTFYSTTGFQFFRPVNLNRKGSELGYPEVRLNFGSGLGGYGEGKHLIYGGEGYYFQHSKSSNSKTTESFGGLGYFYVGYKVVNGTHVKLFPAVGIGMGGVTCTFTDSAKGASIDEILNAQPNTKSFSNGTILIHSSVSIEYKFHKYYFVGLKCGYNFSALGKTPWTAPGLDQQLTMQESFGGFFANAHIGFHLH